MGRIDAIWLATEPIDMRAGTETALARVVEVFGAAKPHCAYLFANRRATRTHTADQGISVIEWGSAREKVRSHKGTPRAHHAKCQLYAKTINTVYSLGFIIF
jgi:hypothetical protein